jgi:hypothetical protein
LLESSEWGWSVAQGIRLRLTTGLRRLEQWSATAGQIERNAVYRALFAIIDGSAFQTYEILDAERTREFFVVVREDLVIKIRLPSWNTFAILYIGAPAAAPDVDLAIGPA